MGPRTPKSKKGRRLTVAERRQIEDLALDGHLPSQIMSILNVGRAAVNRWWPVDGKRRADVHDNHRSGRPRLLSNTDVKAIKRAARGGAKITQISMRRKRAGKAHVSWDTLARAIQLGRKPYKYQRERPAKVLREVNREKRLEFCKTFKCPPGTSLVFMDGKVLTVYKGQRGNLSYRWAPVGEPPVKMKGKLLAHLHFYAAVGHGFRSSLHFVPPSPPVGSMMAKSPETFKAQHYLELWGSLQQEIEGHYKGRQYLIIRDRAPQHIKAEESGALDHLDLPIVED